MVPVITKMITALHGHQHAHSVTHSLLVAHKGLAGHLSLAILSRTDGLAWPNRMSVRVGCGGSCGWTVFLTKSAQVEWRDEFEFV